jgi:hypothetical protein
MEFVGSRYRCPSLLGEYGRIGRPEARGSPPGWLQRARIHGDPSVRYLNVLCVYRRKSLDLW